MRSIPYGYRIEDGQAVIDEKEGQIVKQAYQAYLSGKSLNTISNILGINRNHCGIANLLQDRRYLGTSFYPSIIDSDLFEEVQLAREKSRKKYIRCKQKIGKAKVQTSFIMMPIKQHMKDPFEQAQYVFSLIKVKE